MFLKERVSPDLLESLPRLLHRLSKRHAAYETVALDYYKVKAGFGGEQRVDQILRQSRWRDRIAVIGDLQLADPFCQIDTVILTPHFVLVLEVKNFSGTLSFDEKSYHMKQRTRDGKLLGFNSPVTQAWNAQEEVKILLEEFGILLPVYTCVVLPYSSTLIEDAPVEVPVIYGNSLKRFIYNLPPNRFTPVPGRNGACRPTSARLPQTFFLE